MLLITLLSSCASHKSEMPASLDKEGHRGCRGLMPENTIPAMLKAIDLGVNTIEMDVVFTSDMRAILSHDPFFNHDITTTPDGSFIDERDEKKFNLYKMTYEEVARYDVGLKQNPRFPKQNKIKAVKPLLAAVIDSVEEYISNHHLKPVKYNIETKTKAETDNVFHPAPDVFVDELMKVIAAKKIIDKVIIQSFDVRTLQYLHSKYSNITTSLLIEPKEMISVSKKIGQLGFVPDIVSPEYHMVTNQMIADLHKKSVKVIPWTVNDKKTISQLTEMGVDGIISDYPDLFQN